VSAETWTPTELKKPISVMIETLVPTRSVASL